MFKNLIHKLVDGCDLSEGEMVDAMEVIMGGEAAHALVAADVAPGMTEGILPAAEAIDSGKAAHRLTQLVAMTHV